MTASALTAYRAALTPLQSNQPLDQLQSLTILNARDAVHRALQQSSLPSAYQLGEIQALDYQLQNEADRVTASLNLSAYRKSVPKSSEQWWWYLDQTKTHPSDWAFKASTTLLWAISLGLLINISGRFLLGGAGVAGLSAIAFSNLLTLLKARSDLTSAGSEGAQQIFQRFKLSKPGQIRFRFITLLLLTCALALFWLALPNISRRYYQRGSLLQRVGKLGAAEQNYQRAISLDSDNIEAHYNLGTLYEDIQNLEQAETQYLIAVRGELPRAYNNLARLYLQLPEPKLNQAVAFLNQGLKLADQQQSRPEIKYSFYKNLGWALFELEDYATAESALATAISIHQEPDVGAAVNNPGSAYCLMAQTLEAQEGTNVLSHWQRCCQLGDLTVPEESGWLRLARQRLDAANLDYNETCKATAAPL